MYYNECRYLKLEPQKRKISGVVISVLLMFMFVSCASTPKSMGEMKDGKKHGQGTFTYPNGDKYTGEFKSDLRDGKGVIIYSDGTKYEGNGKMTKEMEKGY